jgi:hypothetical protein
LAILGFKGCKAFVPWFSSLKFKAAMREKEETWAKKSFEIKRKGVYKLVKTWGS